MTANLTLESIPDLDRGEPAWDNVVMNSPALGYVDAMHQSLRTFADRRCGRSTGRSPRWRRRPAASSSSTKDWAYWKEAILTDLERVHPRIRTCVSRLDVMRIGHAMVRPTVGAVFSPRAAGAEAIAAIASSSPTRTSAACRSSRKRNTAASRAADRVLGLIA